MAQTTPSIARIPEGAPHSRRFEFWRVFLSNRLAAVSLMVMIVLIVAALIGPLVYPQSAIKPDYAAINSLPSGKHWLGADNLGRDTLARVMLGLRVSLLVSIYVEALNILLGVTLGLLAGYAGGLADILISRLADILFAFPGLLLAILVTAAFGTAVTEQFGGIGRLLLVAGSLSLVSWPLMARYIRGQTLVLREQDFVEAARSLGAGPGYIIRRHILPNVMGLVIVSSTLDIAGVVVNEAVLSLLGLGIQPPDPSIGKMINEAMPFLEQSPFQVFVPAFVLMLIVLSVSFIGDGLRDAFDPKA